MKKFVKNNEVKTVVSIGKFDGVHKGHSELIKTAVGISKENNYKSLVYVVAPQSHNSILTEEKRWSIIDDIGVDYYCKEKFTPDFMAMSPEKFVDEILIKKLNCAYVVVGYDFRFGKGRCADADDLKIICSQRGIQTKIIDEIRLKGADGVERTVSSSLIRNFVEDGDFKNANLYLGHKFSLSGVVSKGRQLGRTIGFPTANIVPDKNIVPVKCGVYATLCITQYGEFPALTNVGNNPTVSDGNIVTVETNILNFSNDLYGKKIDVVFLKRLRGEEKFPSLNALKMQIEEDRKYVLKKYAWIDKK